EDEEVRARCDDRREREPAPLAARQRRDRLLVRLPAGEEEPPEQRLRLRAPEAGHAHRAVEHAAALVELELLLREVPGDDAVAGGPPQQLLEQRRLAGAVRPDERDVLAALDRERDVGEQVLVTGTQLEALDLDDRPSAARRREELEPERAPPP